MGKDYGCDRGGVCGCLLYWEGETMGGKRLAFENQKARGEEVLVCLCLPQKRHSPKTKAPHLHVSNHKHCQNRKQSVHQLHTTTQHVTHKLTACPFLSMLAKNRWKSPPKTVSQKNDSSITILPTTPVTPPPLSPPPPGSRTHCATVPGIKGKGETKKEEALA